MLVDTSAWIELLRATGHPAHVTLRYHLERRSPIATTEPIIMELLAAPRPGKELHDDRLGRGDGRASLEMVPEGDVSRMPGGTEQLDPGRRVDEHHRRDARWLRSSSRLPSQPTPSSSRSAA